MDCNGCGIERMAHTGESKKWCFLRIQVKEISPVHFLFGVPSRGRRMQVLMGHICFFVQSMPSHGGGSGGRVTRRLGRAKAGHISYPSLLLLLDIETGQPTRDGLRRPSCLPPCISLLNRPRLLVFPVSFLPSPAPSNFPHPFPLDKFFWHETPPAGVEIGEKRGKDLRVQTIRPSSLLFCPFFSPLSLGR